MRNPRVVSQALILSLLGNIALPAWGAQPSVPDSLKPQADFISEAMAYFEEMCLGPDGEILKNTVVVDPATTDADLRPIDCEEEAERLGYLLISMQEIGGSEHAAEAKEMKDCVHCPPLPDQKAPAGEIADFAQAVSGAVERDEAPACKVTNETKELALKCMSETSCNLARSLVVGPMAIAQGLEKIARGDGKTVVPGCLDGTGKSNCIVEIVAGVIKDFWYNATSIWQLVKMGKDALATMDKAQSKSSESMLAASQQAPSVIAQYKKDKVGFIKRMADEFLADIEHEIKTTFGCEKWSGAPHVSECLKPMSTWDCATCDQRLNAMCGVTGFLAGEALVAWASGLLLSGAKVGLKVSAQTAVRANAILTKAIPAVGRVEAKVATVAVKAGSAGAKAAVKTAKIVAKPVAKAATASAKLIRSIAQSKTGQKVIKYVQNGGRAVTAALTKAAGTKTVKLVIKAGGIVTYPVRAYLGLLDKAFRAGWKAVDGPGEKFLALRKAKFASVEKDLMNQADQWHLVVGESGGGQKADDVLKNVQANLEMDGIKSKEVTLPSGQKGVEVELPKGCPKGSIVLTAPSAKK